MGDVILTMKDIDKSFPGVHALDHVNFEVKKGEVHASTQVSQQIVESGPCRNT